MGIKLIASDLDGTFFTDTKEISEENRRAIANAIGKGIYFVPATGRALLSIPNSIRSLSGVEYIITSNGAAIYKRTDPALEEYTQIYRCGLTPGSVQQICSLRRDPKIAMEIYIDGIPYAERRYIEDPSSFGATGYGSVYVQNTRHPFETVEEFVSENLERIDSMAMVCADPIIRETMRLSLQKSVKDIFLTAAVPHLIEIGHKNSGKGNTLRYLLDQLGISADETMAFGDADNDADMLRMVHYGIAMKNGTQVCKDAAFYITSTNEDDGVAKAIDRFLNSNHNLAQ